MNDKRDTIDQPSGFRNLVGYRATVWREGYTEFEIEIDNRHYNSSGFLHGGVYVALLDSAMSHAATWCGATGNARRCVTLSLTTTFLATARTPLVRAVGRLESVSGRTATCRGEVFDGNGELCAAAQGSYRYTRGSENTAGVPVAGEPPPSSAGREQ